MARLDCLEVEEDLSIPRVCLDTPRGSDKALAGYVFKGYSRA